ncbi:MAG: hypothetical protein WCO98_06835 [bacterium]
MGTPTQSKCNCCNSSSAGIIFGVVALLGLAALSLWAINRAPATKEDPESKSDRLLDEIEHRLQQLSEYQKQLDK